MSELNSPFLDNESQENSMKHNQTDTESQIQTGENSQTEVSEDRQFINEHSNEGEIEIKDEGKLLKNIIIILIMLLILSILGLVLYNFIFNKNKEPDIINQQTVQQIEPDISTSTNNFEMRGEDFRAGSVVIE